MAARRLAQLIGTAAYLAPERLDGQPASPASDLYSLGVVLYEALTGDKPFRGDTPVAVAHAILSAPPPRPSEVCPDLDPSLDAVVVRALAKTRDDRYPSAAAMLAALDDTEPSLAVVDEHEPQEPVPSADRTLTFSPSPDADPTVFRREPDTLLAALPEAAGNALAGTGGPEERDGGRWSRTPARWAVLVAGIVVCILIALAVADGRQLDVADPATPTPTTSPDATPTSSLPDPLERALADLERAVQP